MKKSKQDCIKYNTIPKGKLLVVTVWLSTILIVLMGVILLPEPEGIALLVCGAGFLIWLVCLYINKYSNVLEFTNEKITLKKQSISWNDVYVTLYCPNPNVRGYNVYNIYFADHFLTLNETRSWEVKKKGFYIVTNYKRTEYILSHYTKAVKILNFNLVDKTGIMSLIYAHNAKYACEQATCATHDN